LLRLACEVEWQISIDRAAKTPECRDGNGRNWREIKLQVAAFKLAVLLTVSYKDYNSTQVSMSRSEKKKLEKQK